MVRRLGRSQQLLVTALAEQETVAVQPVVENHLGRRPTRSELHAAQRSAHLLAQRGGGTISHVGIRPGMHPSRLAISRQWPDDWLDQGDDADRREAVRWTESRRDAGTPPARFGRWQQVIMDALAQYELVGLRAVLEGHLGRRPAKGESTAAQRAARMMARSGQVRLAHVRVPTIRGHRSAEWVVIGRAEVDPGTITDEGCRQRRSDGWPLPIGPKKRSTSSWRRSFKRRHKWPMSTCTQLTAMPQVTSPRPSPRRCCGSSSYANHF